MSNPLEFIWPLFDGPDLVLENDEVRRWPEAVLGDLRRFGVLRESAHADHASCPDCVDGHVAEVLCRPEPGGRTRFYIPCPENLRVEISENALQRWAIDADAVARLLSTAIVQTPRRTQRTPGRLWRLGAVSWQGVSRDVLLARGLCWPDRGEIIRKVGANGRSIVLVAEQPPPTHIWPELRPTVVSLLNVVRFDRGETVVSLPDILAAVQDTDAANQLRLPVALSPNQQKREFRLAAGDVLKSTLRDEMLVQSYAEHGSVRKAADALTKQLGFKVSKDKVQRAVGRSGGIDAVKRDTDSDSVRRTVASQRRDRLRKFASSTQPPEIE